MSKYHVVRQDTPFPLLADCCPFAFAHVGAEHGKLGGGDVTCLRLTVNKAWSALTPSRPSDRGGARPSLLGEIQE